MICLVTDSLEPSGVGVHMLTLAQELSTYAEVLFVVPSEASGDFLSRARQMGLCAEGWDRSREGLLSILECYPVSLVHAHAGIGWEGHTEVYAARKAGLKVVRTEHLPYLLTDERQRHDYSWLVRQLEHVICVSQAALESYIAADVPRDKLRLVRNGVRSPEPAKTRDDVRAELGIARDAPLLLTVGRFTEQKGHRHLLVAASHVLKRFPNAVFALVGDGPLKAEMEAYARDLGVSDSVRFLGRRDDVPDLLGAADLFVLPSLFEGLPLVLLEATALGLPVVATDVCGNAEVVVTGETGRLVPPKNPTALAAALLETLSHPERTANWGRAGAARFQTDFTAERMARETLSIYRELVPNLGAEGIDSS